MLSNRLRLVIISSLSLYVAAFAFPAFSDTEILSESSRGLSSAAAQSKTVEHWTSERVAAAPPLEMVETIGTGTRMMPEAGHTATRASQATVAPSRSPGSSPGSGALIPADRFHQQAYPEEWTGLNLDTSFFYVPNELEIAVMITDRRDDALDGTESIYTAYTVNWKPELWRIYPHRWQGKLTFTTPSGDASCSATAISNNNIVTAAHCVYDTEYNNRWYTNKAFHPAYRAGQRPYGTFPTTTCSILTAWANLAGDYRINTWAPFDLAVCSVGPNSAGSTLNDAVGWAGRSWNHGYSQLVFQGGYPTRNYNLNILGSPGQYLRSCTAESFQQAWNVLGMGCPYKRGNSGGSWLRHYHPNSTGGNLINSVVSGSFSGDPNSFGVRFTTGNIVALCNARGC